MNENPRLPEEVEELFNYSNEDGLLESNDLEEAGFDYQEEIGDLELWEKNDTQIEYNPETGVIEDYIILD